MASQHYPGDCQPSYFIIELAPEIESKANLQEFFVITGCVHPKLIPVKKAMLAPITEDALGQVCLRYKAMIDIIDVVNLRSAPGAAPTCRWTFVLVCWFCASGWWPDRLFGALVGPPPGGGLLGHVT
jgi:hypothetical protein